MRESTRGDLVIVPGLCVSTYLRPTCDALVLHGPVLDPRQRRLPPAVLHWAADIPREHPSLMVAD